MGVLLILAVIALSFVTGVCISHMRKLTGTVDEIRRRTDQVQKHVDEIEDEMRYLDDRRDSRRRVPRVGRDLEEED